MECLYDGDMLPSAEEVCRKGRRTPPYSGKGGARDGHAVSGMIA